MFTTVKKWYKNSRVTLIGSILALGIVTAGTAMLLQPASSAPEASAASCDKVNIVYCGFKGSSTSSYIKEYQHYYRTGSDGRYNDIRTVYRWSGANDAAVNGMNTGNSKLGTLYRNGDLKVGNKVVGHDAWVSARFGAGRPGFVHVTGNVYARKTTTSLAHDTYKVLVHFNQYGEATYAVMVNCGNAVKFTKVVNKPSLNCESLSSQAVKNEERTYTFTATASAKNTQITSYTFHFGDGATQTVPTNKTQATTTHTYAKADTSYTARVSVNSHDIQNQTSDKCTTIVKIPKIPEAPQLLCDNLTFTLSEQGDNTYTFTARASANNETIQNYVFEFGDGEQQTVTTDQATAQATHQYANNNQDFIAKVTVNGKELKNVTSANCQVTITKHVEECKPGVPVGSPECKEECKPGVPMGSPECQPKVLGTTTELPNTGAGDAFGFFAATAVAGGLIHRYLLRRKLA
jgi:hypothetical protein